MVGFTPLSAARGPEEVLGILSELFADFDQAAERWGVHKVKTIGDAYIVCCGAFYQADKPADAARRVVNMGLSMQQTVIAKAMSKGVDIGVRIGIHTGMVIGGIIGTVRFHFDMWGNGVAGAVRLEELGQRGRVHISDCTEELVREHFPLKPYIGSRDSPETEQARALRDTFGISSTFLVEETQMNMAPYLPQNNAVKVSRENDDSEVLHTSNTEVELAIDEVLSSANGKQGLRGSGSFFTTMRKQLGLPSLMPDPDRQRLRQSTKGVGEVTNAISFMKSLAEGDSDGGGSFSKDGFSGGLQSSSLGSSFGSFVSFATRKTTEKLAGRPERVSTSSASDAAMSGKDRSGTGQRANERKQSISLARNFFVTKSGKRHSMSVDSEANRSIREKQQAAEATSLLDAKRFLTRQAEVRIVVVVVLGLYDFLCGYFAAVDVDASPLAYLLLSRYTGFVPLLLLTRQFIASSGDAPSPNRITLFSIALIVVPTLALMAGIALVGDELTPCPSARAVPICEDGQMGPPPSPPPATSGSDGAPASAATTCALRGTSSCSIGFSDDYVRTLGMLSIFCHYMLVYCKLSTVVTASAVCTFALLLWAGISMRYITYPESTDFSNSRRWGPVDYLEMSMWWLLPHLIGLLHNRLRFLNLFQAQLLRKRHHRLLASIREETEHCEQLLRNILPPHVLVHLGGLLAHADHASKGHQLQAKTIAERYHDCSFLFAKIGGLSKLVNDNSVDPHSMMYVLQIMFDRFDALADMFGVQKVRKTANEYYLVAAGLPNPKLLPTGEDRACGIAGFGFAMINIMNMLNIELEKFGIHFTVQVGIHSGSAIAGIIGHKTFQYDLCGDAVNTAARMCSYSKPGHINISEATYQLLKHRFGAVPRGEIEVKGKGKMNNYYLLNMPVEQQEGLTELAAAMKATESSKKEVVVDSWARTGVGKPDESSRSSGGGKRVSLVDDKDKSGSPGTPSGLNPKIQATGSVSLRAVVGLDDSQSRRGQLTA